MTRGSPVLDPQRDLYFLETTRILKNLVIILKADSFQAKRIPT